MIIPWQGLDAELLTSIVESFVLREGTDYGEQECSLKQKIDDVRHQLKDGKIVLVWSELHKTLNIVPSGQFRDR